MDLDGIKLDPTEIQKREEPPTPVQPIPGPEPLPAQPTRRLRRWWLVIIALVLLVAVGGYGAIRLLSRPTGNARAPAKPPPLTAAERAKISGRPLGISELAVTNVAAQAAEFSQLTVTGHMHFNPTTQPSAPAAGDLYYDQAAGQLAFYNGTQFIGLQGGGNGSLTTNIFGGGGGFGGAGTTGNIAMFTGPGTLGNSLLSQSGQTVTIGSATSSSAVNIGTGAGVQTVSLGSSSSSSATTIQGGTGNLVLATGPTSGSSGDISITTGNSSTTASGNITIDAGSGIIDGEVVETKTFETDTDNMLNWFGSTVTQSSAQAHTGANSLSMTATAGFWGVQENINNPITPVVAGHQYHFSMWVRAGSTPRVITARAVWVGGGGPALNLQTVTDNASGWTEITGTGVAPGGATGVYNTMQGIATVGEVHYFDDVVVTDLSSSSAASTINIGNVNAKIITLGNINQIGPTSILGGSGINLNSGSGGINVNGGAINITGNAVSNFTTSTGALTLTSAASALWSVATATSGVGGDLMLRAGNGGTDDNNDGGDLILQGGRANGTGVDGSVVIKPQADSTNIFQIQNAAGTPLLTVDSSGRNLTVVGTDTAYASLTLADAHFGSTQTSPPTIGTPTSCGTSPTAAVTAGSTDSAGSFTITTGTGGTSSTCTTTITFHQAYGAAPKSIIVMGKTDAASAARQIFVSAATTTTFTVSFATSAGGANSTPYQFSYWIIE